MSSPIPTRVTANSPNTDEAIKTRKADHLRICLDDKVQCKTITTGFERYRFQHCCLPELALEDIQLSTTFLGKPLGAPLLISSMTGGTELAKTINQRLAIVAQEFKIAMGVGSQRVAVEHPQVADTFAVRSHAPDIPLFANLGAVQLNYGYTIESCRRSIDLLEADALILHLNPLQECIQSRGDTNFRNLFTQIGELCHQLPIPVIVKEVGNGISAPLALRLIDVGVAAIDVAGAGGTSWAKVEGERAEDPRQRRLGQTFSDWGLPTAECVASIHQANAKIPLIASGGLRNGLDAAKALALGADLAGMAYPFLQAAHESDAALHTLMELLIAELETVLFCTGNATLADLQASPCLIHD
ncbi:type 2 isopentenyl-diphosphate Delta-isomerase [Acaryochloris sp. IP29b_bin.148]|uniref:type 2 isopentenyl-diphosphate Delta-isomerase n=1 Tax=Acaryochloris sp. IP29b_bin.148 TaxID=2969218 RepID=UPI00261095E9|nr:type 2 isopentenyl-diphosphate Delta-isomerase [Acaryochloris sp. IP29b_bin.148]